MPLNSTKTARSAVDDITYRQTLQTVWQPFAQRAQRSVLVDWVRVFRGSRGALVLTLGLISAILYWRRPDAFRNPQFWAEDCIVFFVQQRAFGWRAILMPYCGYLHLLPRLIALAAGRVPLRWVPCFYNMGALGCVLATSAMIVRARLDERIQAFFALALVLVPHNGEVFMNITNIQWMSAPLLLILALQQNPRSVWQAGFDILALCLLGLTGPFIVLWLPILVLRPFAFGRTLYNGLFVGLAVALAAVQFTQMHALVGIMAKCAQSSAFPSWKMVAELSVSRFLGYFFLGFEQSSLWHLIIIGAAAVATVTLLIVLPGPSRLRGLAICAAAVVVYVSSIPKFAALITVVSPGMRYFYIPSVLFCWLYILSLRNPRPAARFTSAILLGLLMLAMYRHSSAGQMQDLHWRQYASAIELGESKGEAVLVPINPGLTVAVGVRESVRSIPLHGPSGR